MIFCFWWAVLCPPPSMEGPLAPPPAKPCIRTAFVCGRYRCVAAIRICGVPGSAGDLISLSAEGSTGPAPVRYCIVPALSSVARVLEPYEVRSGTSDTGT